ncbi:MAG: glycosyltransferase family 1 protein [Patescibacteria group bacterium]|nr:glycosyltransferase family 1 protein [Patescibacteria group bacterium]
MKTIGIDARFYGAESRGLGKYTTMLLKYLEELDDKNRYLVYLREQNFDEYLPRKSNFIKQKADVPWYSLKEQIAMPLILNKRKIDLMHFPHFNIPLFYRGPFMVTIHDLILMEHPTIKATTLGPLKYNLKKIGYKTIFKKAVTSSQAIIAVSNFTKQDIIKHFPQTKLKIKVIYEGCENDKNALRLKSKRKSVVTKLQLGQYGINKPYLLYIGAAYPHKNLESLVLAFEKIKRDKQWRKLSLVLVGGDDYFYKRLKSFTKRKGIKNVIFPGLIREEKTLQEIYRNAEIFVFPSLYEGFGLPPLEAMTMGVPVVCSKATSLPEILARAASYFNPKDVRDITNKILRILENSSLKRDLVEEGYKRIELFSWQKMAQQTLEIYNRILKN